MDDKWTNGINNALNTNFEPSGDIVKDMTNAKNNIIEKKNKIVESVQNVQELSLKDADFIRDEIQELIISTKVILNRLEETLQIGAPPRAFEVYATLVTARLNSLKELRDLNKTEIDVKVINNKGREQQGPTNNNLIVMLDNKELDKMVARANRQNLLNDISTDFQVSEEDIK